MCHSRRRQHWDHAAAANIIGGGGPQAPAQPVQVTVALGTPIKALQADGRGGEGDSLPDSSMGPLTDRHRSTPPGPLVVCTPALTRRQAVRPRPVLLRADKSFRSSAGGPLGHWMEHVGCPPLEPPSEFLIVAVCHLCNAAALSSATHVSPPAPSTSGSRSHP